MSDDDDNNQHSEPAIHKVDTVPPPAGEDDAYSAPTRVGSMAAAAVEELMRQAEKTAGERPRSAQSTTQSTAPSTPPVSPAASRSHPPPRVYEDDVDDDATVVNPNARPPVVTVARPRADVAPAAAVVVPRNNDADDEKRLTDEGGADAAMTTAHSTASEPGPLDLAAPPSRRAVVFTIIVGLTLFFIGLSALLLTE